jgi:8-oxo-dGTP diphosphatase
LSLASGPEPGSAPREIAIAVVWRGGRVLITRRPPGAHLAGLWEFPGGKVAEGETVAAAAEREVREETGISCRATGLRTPFIHIYPDRTVRLNPVDCEWQAGEPELLGVAAARWVGPADLTRFSFPPANGPLLAELLMTGGGETREAEG